MLYDKPTGRGLFSDSVKPGETQSLSPQPRSVNTSASCHPIVSFTLT